MHEIGGRIRAAVLFELDSQYAFPFFEGAFALVTLMSFYYVLSSHFGWDLVVPFQWNGAYYVDAYMRAVPLMAAITLGGCIMGFSQVFAVLVPILVSLNVARELESGMMRTKLSYPIVRSELLLTKCLLVASVTVLPASLMSLFGVLLFEPGPMDFGVLAAHVVSLWLFVGMVISISVITSLVSRGLPSALFSGLVGSVGLTQLPLLVKESPLWIDSFLNPVHGVVRTFDWIRTEQECALQLFAGFGLAMTLIISLLIMSTRIFSRVEA